MSLGIDIPTLFMGTVLSVAATAIFLTWTWSITIPHGRAAALETWGRFDSILGPGFYVLKPWQRLHKTEWSYRGQDNRGKDITCYVRSDTPRTDNAEMDVPEYECTTKDGIQVRIDGTILYHIIDLKVAMYKVANLLGHLSQAVRQAVRFVAGQHNAAEMIGNDNTLSSEVVSQVNSRVSDYGIECPQFLVQDIRMDSAIMKAKEKLYAHQKENEMLRANQANEHVRKMEALQAEKEQQAAQHAMEMTQRLHSVELEDRASTAEVARARNRNATEITRYENMLVAGLSDTHIVDLERARESTKATETSAREWTKAMQAVARSRNKVVYMPTDLMRGGMVMRSGRMTEDT